MPTVIKNIVGEVFGDLTVIGENREQSALRAVCRCSCGNEYIVQYNRLTRGLVTQCKVCKKEKGARRSPDMSDDAEGSTSHTLVFTGNARTEGVRQYYCTCTVCGKSSWYTKRLFRLGYAKCDCERLMERRRHFIEVLKKYRVMKYPKYNRGELLQGTKYGKLTVIKRTENPPHDDTAVWYDCVCDCGSVVSVRRKLLLNGMTRSCGCLHKETFAEAREYPDWVRPLLFKESELVRLDKKEINLYSDEVTLECSVCGNPFTKRMKDIISNEYRVPVCLECGRRTSAFEEEVSDYVMSLVSPEMVRRHERSVMENGLEYDIFIPSMNLAIECNGDYWHSEKIRTDRRYHYRKWKDSMSKGIRLVQIYQTSWNVRKDAWKAFLNDLLVPRKVLYARRMELRKATHEEALSFYSHNHMQGLNARTNVSVTYALADRDTSEVFCMMSFSLPKFKDGRFTGGQYELLRFAVRHGYSVVGGASRLLRAFEREYIPSSVVSYSDCDLFTGGMYASLGFEFIDVSFPYYWAKGVSTVVRREQVQVKKLKVLYPALYEEAVSCVAPSKEIYIMEKLGYFRVTRSGNLRWIKYYDEDMSAV